MGEHSTMFFFFLLETRERCPWCCFSGGPKTCFNKRIYMSITISAGSWLRVPYIVCVWWGPRSARAIALIFWGPRFLLLFGLHVCNRRGLRVHHTVGLGPHLLYIL